MSNKSADLVISGVVGILTAIGFYVFLSRGGDRDAQVEATEKQIARVEVTRARVDTVYDTARVAYVEYRDRILRSGTATPRDSLTFKKADAVVVACDTLRAVDTVLVHDLKKEIQILKEPGPRVQPFVEGLYDLARAQPLARVGVETRAWRSFYIVVAGEGDLATPRQRGALRAVIGGRVNF